MLVNETIVTYQCLMKPTKSLSLLLGMSITENLRYWLSFFNLLHYKFVLLKNIRLLRVSFRIIARMAKVAVKLTLNDNSFILSFDHDFLNTASASYFAAAYQVDWFSALQVKLKLANSASKIWCRFHYGNISVLIIIIFLYFRNL